MYIFFLDKNNSCTGTVNSEFDKKIEITLPSGEKKRIHKNKTPHILFTDSTTNIIEKSEQIFSNLNINCVWKVAPKEEFTVCELNNIFFAEKKSIIQKAALLMCLIRNPIFFKKKENGIFTSVSKQIIDSALRSKKLKEQRLEDEQLLVDEILDGKLPKKIREMGMKLLFEADKNSIELRALKRACVCLNSTPKQILYNFKVLTSAFEFHKLFFLKKMNIRGYKKIRKLSKSVQNNPLENFDFPFAKVEAFSIDDRFTTEIDDALSLQKVRENDCEWTVGIHIALPVNFITPSESKSIGIRDQALSIYTPSDKKTMLPSSILKMASLRENKFNPVISLYIDFDESGSILSNKTVIEKVFIKKNIRLGSWENEFEANPITSKLPWKGLTDLHFLAKCLLEERSVEKQESIRPSTELKIHVIQRGNNDISNLDMEGTPITKIRKRGSMTDLVVSEFMILANTIWAKNLKNSSIPAIFRVNKSGVTSMKTISEPHEDLGVEAYAWTTSPLRRYVDYLNQWQLICSVMFNDSLNTISKNEIRSEITNFEKKQFLYRDFQKFMERYWSYRLLITKTNKAGETWKKNKNNSLFLVGIHLGKGNFGIADTPLTFKFNELIDYKLGKKISLEVESINCLDMKVKFCRA